MSTKSSSETELIGGAAAGRGRVPPEVRDRLSDEVIDRLLAGARSEDEVVGPGGVLARLTRPLVERALAAELSEQLGYQPHREPPGGVGNTRKGSTAKTLQTEQGPVEIRTPRDRNGSVDPQLVRNGSSASRLRRQDPRPLLAPAVDSRHRRPSRGHVRRPGGTAI